MRVAARLKNLVGRAWLAAFGWQVEGGKPAARKAVVVAAPHTSNWDFPFTMAIAWSIGLDIAWLGKDTMFRWPVAGIFRAWGGIPVDRRAKHDLVAQVADQLRAADDLYVILSPEGSRRHVDRWKTGFYHIAVAADVPVILGFLDYGTKRGGLGTMFEPSGDLAADAAAIRAFYQGKQGKLAHKFAGVKLDLTAPADAPAAASESASASAAATAATPAG
ncbi:MAG: 1-acyl-sn-glycerol-3-phosphate acyltransferase [Myxococcales bacterium]|nr:1-acyl-sn-glycerol-3-phosphate acyltransferase [Myxococcales bacterium]